MNIGGALGEKAKSRRERATRIGYADANMDGVAQMCKGRWRGVLNDGGWRRGVVMRGWESPNWWTIVCYTNG